MTKAEELFELHLEIYDSVDIHEYSGELYKRYASLSQFEEEEFIDLILDKYTIHENMDRYSEEVAMLTHASIFTSGNAMRKVYPELIENNIFFPPEMYINGGDEEARGLIRKLEEINSHPEMAEIIRCLSFIECETVKEFLVENKVYKKAHNNVRYMVDIKNNLVGGWTINGENEIRKLYSEKITVFKRGEESKKSFKAPMRKSEEVCPYCGNKLIIMFEDEYEMTTCDYCVCYQDISMKIQENGKAYWHEENKKSNLLDNILKRGDSIPDYDYYLEESNEIRKPAYTTHEYAYISRTQLGGLPSLSEEYCYAECIECCDIMKFVGQMDMKDIMEYGEGIYYFYYCEECKVLTCSFGTS